MYVALHRGLSQSHSRSVTRIVKYRGEGICGEGDCVSFYSESSGSFDLLCWPVDIGSAHNINEEHGAAMVCRQRLPQSTLVFRPC